MNLNAETLLFTDSKVYKSPQLDFVAWFAIGTSAGPQPHHLRIHERLQEAYNEAAAKDAWQKSLAFFRTNLR